MGKCATVGGKVLMYCGNNYVEAYF